MSKLKSNIKNMVLSLTLITLVASVLLAYVNEITSSKIEALREATLQDGIKSVMGDDNSCVVGADTIFTDGNNGGIHFVVYDMADAQGKELGKAVVAVENGFAGPLTVLVGFDKSGDIKGYTIINTTETPGLGLKAQEWFRSGKGNIIGLNPSKSNLTVSKDGGDVDAITASTITSRAFLKAVVDAYNQTKKDDDGADAHSGASVQHKD